MRKCLGIFQGFKNATLFSVTMCSDADVDNSGVVPGDRVSTQHSAAGPLVTSVQGEGGRESPHSSSSRQTLHTLLCGMGNNP